MEKFVLASGYIFIVLVLIALVIVLILLLDHAVASGRAVNRIWKAEKNKSFKVFINSIKYWFRLTITGESWNVMINTETNERIYWPGKEPKKDDEDDSDDHSK